LTKSLPFVADKIIDFTLDLVVNTIQATGQALPNLIPDLHILYVPEVLSPSPTIGGTQAVQELILPHMPMPIPVESNQNLFVRLMSVVERFHDFIQTRCFEMAGQVRHYANLVAQATNLNWPAVLQPAILNHLDSLDALFNLIRPISNTMTLNMRLAERAIGDFMPVLNGITMPARSVYGLYIGYIEHCLADLDGYIQYVARLRDLINSSNR
jgi:hypothetical protein